MSLQSKVVIVKYPREYPRDLKNLEPPGFNDPDDIREVPQPTGDNTNGTGSNPLPG